MGLSLEKGLGIKELEGVIRYVEVERKVSRGKTTALEAVSRP